MNTEYPPPSSSPAPDQGTVPAQPSRRSGVTTLCLLTVVLVGGLSVWQWFDTRQQVSGVRQEVARRLADADALAKSGADAGRSLRESSERLNERLEAVEAHLAENKDSEAALQALYQDVARGREEAELLQVEQAITLAAQQIQLAGNVPVALLALRAADAQLARLDKARHLPLRKALAADIARLNGLPLLDLPGISLRIEQLVGGVDKFPFAVYGRPAEDPQSPALDAAGQLVPAKPWWQVALADVWSEARSLIRIQRFDREEPALLAPGQGFFLRENLKLRLLSARLALFARDQWTYRNELAAARDWLNRHFSQEDRAVQAAMVQLKEMAAADIAIELPDLRASQQALIVLREDKEKR